MVKAKREHKLEMHPDLIMDNVYELPGPSPGAGPAAYHRSVPSASSLPSSTGDTSFREEGTQSDARANSFQSNGPQLPQQRTAAPKKGRMSRLMEAWKAPN